MSLHKSLNQNLLLTSLILMLTACGGGSSGSTDSGSDTDAGDDTDTGATASCDDPITELAGAFLEFEAAPNVAAVLSADGCTVAFEADGKPDHTSAYWDPNGSSGLWVEAEDPDTFGDPGQNPSGGQASPGYIDNYTNDYDLTVSVAPELAASSSGTALGAIGIALSGTPIFNDQEGTGAVSIGVAQGLDRNGAHTGPETYHYHLEPAAISDDDENLIGVIADGFFLYGRKCYSTGDYPTDLDDSNGHTTITQYTGTADEDAVYHYHIDQEDYLFDGSGYYLAFPGDYQGTPSAIN